MPNQHTKAREMEQEFLKTARDRWEASNKFFQPIYEKATEDLEFLVGDQWIEEIKKQRELAKRPCLTMNRLWPYVHQVTNEQRQNRPSIQVNPVDSGADVETARIKQGLIRHIEYNSNADSAYTTAFFYASSASIGFFRILTDYVNPLSFEQEIYVVEIDDPASVRFDPASKTPDGSDANWAFVFSDMPREEFERLYPGAKGEQGFDWDTWQKEAPDWFEGKKVRVAEYFYKDQTADTLLLLPDGETVLKSKATEAQIASAKDERDTIRTIVKWAKITGTKILEETVWPDEAIPVIPVYGDKVIVKGEQHLSGIIRFAKDPARQYNFMQTLGAETIGLSAKAPYIAAEGQIEPFKKEWEQANTSNQAVLRYKPTTLEGHLVGAPQRNAYEPPVQAISHYMMQAVDDLKATTGIFDPSLGNREQAQSGVAISRLQNQSGTANYHYLDNLSKSLRQAGRILLRLTGKIYDTARTIRIIGEDGKQSLVKINQDFEEKGKRLRYDMNAGTYDVTISTGPGYQTQRQEAQAFLERVIQARPDLMTIAGDLVMRMQDSPMAGEIADRIEKTLPPELRPEKEGEPAPVQIPPEIQQKLAQAEQIIPAMQQQMQAVAGQMQQLEQQNQMLTMQLKNKETENQIKGMEAASDAQIEQQKLVLDEQKLAIEAEKVRLEGEKLELEKLRIVTDAAKQPEAPVCHSGEPVEPSTQLATKEDLVQMFSLLTAPMPPQRVVLFRTPEGGMVGRVEEVPQEPQEPEEPFEPQEPQDLLEEVP